MKKYRITVFCGGGEYTGGHVTEPEVKDFIREKIEDGELCSFDDLPNGDSFNPEQYTDILAAYGPAVGCSTTLIVEEINGDDEKVIFEGDFEESDAQHYTHSNPWPTNEDGEYNDDDLIIYTQKYEKRISMPAIVELEDDVEFELDNVYVGSVNMDETINGDEIAVEVLYIPKDKAAAFVKEFLGDDDEEELAYLIPEIGDDAPDILAKIYEYNLELEDICGKGETENDYMKVVDLKENVLYEGGEY